MNALTDLHTRYGRFLAIALIALVVSPPLLGLSIPGRYCDLFVYRAGAALALEGRSPFDTAAVREKVVAEFPAPDLIDEHFGFFLPPHAILVFAPFAKLPWNVAVVAWTVLSVTAAGFAARRLAVFASAPTPVWIGSLLVGVVLLNPVFKASLLPAQTAAFAFACVVFGEVAARSGRPRLAGLLWAIPFLKPHVALPLLPLAWWLGGWRRAAILVGWLAALNLAGCLIVGSIDLPWNYLDYLSAGHRTVVANRAEANPQITSWNRLLLAGGGPVIELSVKEVLLGYAVWAALVALRIRLAGARPTPGWMMAVAFAGSMVCCQVMGYETVILAVGLPHILDLVAARRFTLAALLVATLAFASMPFDIISAWAESLRPIVGKPAAEVLRSHRALGAALLATITLVGGWPRATSSTS